MLFQEPIRNLADWGRVFQKKECFEPLIRHILQKNGLPFSGVDNCTPGSNAVFRVGDYIVKIFAPEESEIGGEGDFLTEKFGLARANRLQIGAPHLYAGGEIRDRYVFRYLILEYVEGRALAQVSQELSAAERERIGRKLRQIVDRLDTACERFNDHFLRGKAAEQRWEAFAPEFQRERRAYLANREPARNQEQKQNREQAHAQAVFVHGDLNPDNILLKADGEICLIDFADALLAPMEVELAAVICDGFHFDRAYQRGFLGDCGGEALAERLLYGLLLHDFGTNIIRDNIGDPQEIRSLQELRDQILRRI